MFTVVICSNAFLQDLKRNFSHVSDLLFRQKNCAVCAWDPAAASFEEALGGLRELVRGADTWRAVVVQDACTFGFSTIDRRNPFDAVGALPVLQPFGEEEIFSDLDDLETLKKALEGSGSTAEQRQEWKQECQEIEAALGGKIAESCASICSFREKKRRNYEQATESALTRLAIWLLGSPLTELPQAGKGFPEELLKDECPVDRAYYERLFEMGICATELEQIRASQEQYRVLSARFLPDSMLERRPQEVLVVSERFFKRDDDVLGMLDHTHEELEYNNFADDNLYPAGMDFVFCDVKYENKIRFCDSYLAFVTFVYLLACNEVPLGAMRSRCVYRADVLLSLPQARRFFALYLKKLDLTKKLIESELGIEKRREDSETELEKKEAVGLFESDAHVPVKVRDEGDTKDLYAQSGFGLSRDCPWKDEYDYWYGQVCAIKQRFVRYLREPRRAIRHATKEEFRSESAYEDERILRLNEDRLEDIAFRLEEEERKMVETVTPDLFLTSGYFDRIEEADQEVRGVIFKRMTKKRTVCTALIAAGSFLLGFLPLIFDNFRDMKAVVGSLSLAGIAMGAFLVVGFVFVWWMRRRLLNRVRHFNMEMDGILSSLQNGMEAFSRYLSHACNVMRCFSVFNYLRRPTGAKKNTLKKHLHDIECKIAEVSENFGSHEALLELSDVEIRPYLHDFTRAVDYTYDIPYLDTSTRVEFLKRGNFVETPLDYITAVVMEREDIYD